MKPRTRVIIRIKRQPKYDNLNFATKRMPSEEDTKLCTEHIPETISTCNNDTLEDFIKREPEDGASENLLEEKPNFSLSKCSGFNFFCNKCNRVLSSFKAIRHHRATVHKIKYPELHKVKHMELTPDVYDPNFHCPACEKTFKTNMKYRAHLKQIHLMTLIPLERGPYNVVSCSIKNKNLLPDVEDPNFHCRACEKTYKNNMKYRAHLRHIHKMKLARLTYRLYPETETEEEPSHATPYPLKSNQIKHHDLIPDVDDPNFYCQACEKTYSSKAKYRHHLKYGHRMELVPLIANHTNDIVPDVDDPNFYCRSCERKYVSIYKYRVHLKKIHKMDLPRLARPNPPEIPIPLIELENPNSYCKVCLLMFGCKIDCGDEEHKKMQQPDRDDPNLHCKVCNITFTKKRVFGLHCKLFHPVDPPKQPTDITPDVTDPNNYCKVCDRTYCGKNSYRQHLRFIHRMMSLPSLLHLVQKADSFRSKETEYTCHVCKKDLIGKPSLVRHMSRLHPEKKHEIADRVDMDSKPDIYDPNNYCRSCDRSYKSKSSFISHVRIQHSISLRNVRHQYNHETLPDPNDPNLSCSVCNTTYKAMANFRTHCKLTHGMTFPRTGRFANPDAKINLDSPDLFCAKCGKYYKTPTMFRSHLRVVHNLRRKTYNKQY